MVQDTRPLTAWKSIPGLIRFVIWVQAIAFVIALIIGVIVGFVALMAGLSFMN